MSRRLQSEADIHRQRKKARRERLEDSDVSLQTEQDVIEPEERKRKRDDGERERRMRRLLAVEGRSWGGMTRWLPWQGVLAGEWEVWARPEMKRKREDEDEDEDED